MFISTVLSKKSRGTTVFRFIFLAFISFRLQFYRSKGGNRILFVSNGFCFFYVRSFNVIQQKIQCF